MVIAACRLVPVNAERTTHGDRRVAGRGMLRFVFYGRVSTEDWQHPVTSNQAAPVATVGTAARAA